MKYFLNVCLIISIVSCNYTRKTFGKDETSNANNSNALRQYMKFSDEKCDASILIQESKSFNGSSMPSESISAGLGNYSIEQPKQVSINSIILNDLNGFAIDNSEDHNKSLNVFGEYVNLKMDNEVLLDSFYCPKKIEISCKDILESNGLKSGMEFIWKPDARSKGVFVSLDAPKQLNLGSKSNKQRYLWISDNGKFVVPKDFLNGFENKSDVHMTMSRINYTIVTTTGGQKVQFYCVTGCSTFFINGLK